MKIRTNFYETLGLVLLALASVPAQAQVTREDYSRAEKFLHWNADKIMFKLQVNPTWIGKSDRFWYRNDTREGKEFWLVDPYRNTLRPAFDHAKLAEALSGAEGKNYLPSILPFESIEFIKEGKEIQFDVEKTRWTCDLATYKCEGSELIETPPNELLSPDGRWIAFVREYNLYVRSVETGKEIQLSLDGEEFYDYATPLPSPQEMIRQGTTKPTLPLVATWSPDSKKLLTYRIDQRKAGRHHWLQFSPPGGGLPKLYSSAYPLPGERDLPKAEPVIFDVEKTKQIPVDSEPHPMLYYGTPPVVHWNADGLRFTFRQIERGYKSVRLRETDASTGQTRTIVDEQGNPYIDNYDDRTLLRPPIIGGGSEIIWYSETDGWGHLYLYDGKTGTFKNHITKGQWVVRQLLHVDEKARQVYFTAGGREEGRDPYLRHLYRVNMDGANIELLTPENADHEVKFSPTGEYFVDTFSKVNTVPVSVLRRSSDGRIVRELERADLELLLALGYKWPEPFRAKARDGKTDIYGVLLRPSNLDPSKKYPILDCIYSGPHGIHTPKSFPRFPGEPYKQFEAQAIAELGFIVVMIDGMGQNFRSKAFHNVQYKNLGDAGLEDHITGIKQIAARYPYMDLSRVGIFGGSAGGYPSTRALLTHPEFYKVAVSRCGNHDLRLDKAVWVEQWMGFPVDDHYREQANSTIAHKLQGKLLLAVGDLDTNVPPASTIQLVDALIKANKDFDLLLIPNGGHSLGRDSAYFNRKRWDYFVKHLLRVEPPKDYKIEDPLSREISR